MFKVIQTPLPINQYYPYEVEKKQIILHHTVSDPFSPLGDINSWNSDTLRIATYAIISHNGDVNKCFKSTQWAASIGLKAATLKQMGYKDYGTRNVMLDKGAIAIEIDAWGGLVLGDGTTKQFGSKGNQPHFVNTIPGKFYNAYGNVVSDKLEVEQCNWRGFNFFQKYSDAQIQTLSELLPLLMKANNIPNYGIRDGNLNVRCDAIDGNRGILSHTSYRRDKSDIYPDARLIGMLNNLKV